MLELRQVLMVRYGMTSDEADELIAEMREEIENGADPKEVLHDIGYVLDILGR